MGWLWAFIIGLVVGLIAKLLMPGKDPGGFFITAFIGIGGAMLATFLGRQIGWYQPGQAAGFLMSVIGAILVLALYRAFIRKRNDRPS